jgi:hypothetical protein
VTKTAKILNQTSLQKVGFVVSIANCCFELVIGKTLGQSDENVKVHAKLLARCHVFIVFLHKSRLEYIF